MNKLVKWFEMHGKNDSHASDTSHLSYLSASFPGTKPNADSITLIIIRPLKARLLTPMRRILTDFLTHDFQRLTDFNGL